MAATSGCLVLLAWPASAALAADGESTPLNLESADPAIRSAQAPGAGGGTIVRTIVGLAVVIAVIYGLTWVLKQMKASKEDRATGAGLVPLATLPLGPNRALHLVRAGAEVVLVGAAEHGVTGVRTYTEDEARRLGLLADDDPGDPGPPSAPVAAGAAPAPVRRWLEQIRSRTVIR